MYYRLNVFPIHVPSLRDRTEDIPVLTEYLIGRYAKRAGKRFSYIKRSTIEMLRAYSWPGNIRELQNVIERAVILCEDTTFSIDENWLKRESPRISVSLAPLASSLADREREMIEAALAESKGRISGPSGAAARLGVPRQTLDSKIASLQISKIRFKTRPLSRMPVYS
jgi:formate hydrogenlyase transcriptional activator